MSEQEISRILAISQEQGDFVTGDDGFVIFWPSANRGGLTSWMLRALADEIDRRNVDAEAALAAYFATCRCDGPCECTPTTEQRPEGKE